MKLYQKINFVIRLLYTKFGKKIPRIFFLIGPVTTQTLQCLLLIVQKLALMLYRGGGGSCNLDRRTEVFPPTQFRCDSPYWWITRWTYCRWVVPPSVVRPPVIFRRAVFGKNPSVSSKRCVSDSVWTDFYCGVHTYTQYVAIVRTDGLPDGNFALVRLWLGFGCLLFTFWCLHQKSREIWLMLLGQLNVRRMSGIRIASVCRLRACAPNYLPTILLSCLTSNVMLVDKI